MTGLAEQRAAAAAELARLDRAISQATCAEIGEHAWRLVGGRNAGCDDACCCSIPVYECTRCHGCDYGENSEAAAILARCGFAQDIEKDNE